MPKQIETEPGIISRKAARKRGFSRYFTGHPCLRGHVAERFVASRRCIECEHEWARAYQKTPAGREKYRRDNASLAHIEAEERHRTTTRRLETVFRNNQTDEARQRRAVYEQARPTGPAERDLVSASAMLCSIDSSIRSRPTLTQHARPD